jgi:hypothetical protein
MVKPPALTWFASIFAAALAVVVAAWCGRGLLERRATGDAALQFSRELQTLDERQAVRRISQLSAADGPWLHVLVAAWADSRVEVARAARQTVLSEVERWSQQPADFEPPLAGLARLLAQHAPQMNAVEREAARALAERLLLWPAQASNSSAEQLIADCQSVLGLPAEPAGEIRLAATPAGAVMPQDAPQEASLPVPDALPPTLTPAPIPPAAESPPPLPLADANQETPARPRPFAAPKAIRISDD